MEMSAKLHAPAALLQGKTLYTYEQEAGWAPRTISTYRRGEKSFSLVRIRN
jgi:hypothetical protein